MKNYLIIQFTQNLPTRLARLLNSLKSHSTRGEVGSAESAHFLEGIDYYQSDKAPKPKRALVALHPQAWLTALAEYPNIKRYNHTGFVFGLVTALNKVGYVVDLVNLQKGYKIFHDYDLFVGHGGGCKDVLTQLPNDIPIFQYISGLYWKVFDEESDARYERFYRVHGGEMPKSHRRSITHMIDGLEYLNETADVLFTINCPRMIEAYGRHKSKFHFTGLGAYVDPLLDIQAEERMFDLGRENFVYVGGTGGNLQKGLDLLIEAFADLPHLNLYIYCKVEEEILNRCRNLLRKKNIHYIYHWRYPVFKSKLRNLMKRTNFSVHAPINIGMGTAFMATLGVGMIPVGYVDIADPEDGAVLTDSWQVEDLKNCVREASQKSPEWCQKASTLSRERYQKFCEPEQVHENFVKMFRAVEGEKLTSGASV
jgi:glycosyltransferase involved in cell wall biosynthesis